MFDRQIRKLFRENRDDNNPCWDGYEMVGMKTKDGKEVPNCVPISEDEYEVDCESITCHKPIEEAEYQGKEVKLNDPFRLPSGSNKKFGVYVKDGDKVKKVTFGSSSMEIKRDDAEARKSFRARHKCDQKKDKTSAGYWSCRMWEKGTKVYSHFMGSFTKYHFHKFNP